MITDALLSVLTAIPMGLISLLPEVDFEIPQGALNWIYDIANAVGYLLPVKSLAGILIVAFSIKAFQIVWALLLRVKSFIPTMGA